MDILPFLERWIDLEAIQDDLIRLVIFTGLILGSLVIGRLLPMLLRWLVNRLTPQQVSQHYNTLITPIRGAFNFTSTVVFILLSVEVLQDYMVIYRIIHPIIKLVTIVSVAWLISQLFRQLMRTYGIKILQDLGRSQDVDTVSLVIETAVNLVVGLTAVLAFAQSLNLNLVGLVASFGVGGIAVAFAAQNTLEQLLGTVVLYLDRPFVAGDYIRVTLNPHVEPEYGRIESIGIRSTKLRSAAKNTLIVIPNSTLANLDIENISRGKKVMVLLYLDFKASLEEKDQALVQQVVTQSLDTLVGVDPGSNNIAMFEHPDHPKTTRARVTFFIMGSSEDSIELRKELLHMTNEAISKKLAEFGLEFELKEPNIYVDSPITL